MRRTTADSLLDKWPKGLLGLLGLPLLHYAVHRTGAAIEPVLTSAVFVAAATWFFGRLAGYLAALGASGVIAQSLSVHFGFEPSASTVIWSLASEPFALFGTAHLLAKLRHLLDSEREQARRDPMTGVDNRLAFEEKAERVVTRAKRRRAPVTMAFIDCDDFKSVNDMLGHAAGDDLLRTIAQTLRASVRPQDVVARLGGDEFAVIFKDCHVNGSHQAVRRLRKVLGQELRAQGWNVTLSIGVATFNSSRGSYKDILRVADRLQYNAKATGKNAVIYGVVEDPEASRSHRRAVMA